MSDGLSANKAAVRTHFAALQTGDFSVLDDVHDAAGRNHAQAPFDVSSWPDEGVPFAAEDVRGTFAWLRQSMPDLVLDIEALVAEDDQVIAWIRLRGTPSGAHGPAPAGGGSVDFRHVHRFRLENARIVEHWAVRDDLRALVQSGVVTPPAGPGG